MSICRNWLDHQLHLDSSAGARPKRYRLRFTCSHVHYGGSSVIKRCSYPIIFNPSSPALMRRECSEDSSERAALYREQCRHVPRGQWPRESGAPPASRTLTRSDAQQIPPLGSRSVNTAEQLLRCCSRTQLLALLELFQDKKRAHTWSSLNCTSDCKCVSQASTSAMRKEVGKTSTSSTSFICQNLNSLCSPIKHVEATTRHSKLQIFRR